MVAVSEPLKSAATISDYLRIARPDHWFKNIFMLPGTALALAFTGMPLHQALLPSLIALLSLCFGASANYVINEWLDAKTDQHHPVKKHRPGASRILNTQVVIAEYLILAAISLYLSLSVSYNLMFTICFLLFMGLNYNVPPVRLKDKVYLDVLSESVNNPIRLIIGWLAIVPTALPPSTILLSYWMGGAFLMAIKRFAEYRMIDDRQRAASYRKSFEVYSEDKLLVSAFFYALCSTFFLGIFLIKYRIEFLLTFPLFALLFVWYLRIALRRQSVVQTPEKLYRERRFVAFVATLGGIVILLFLVDIPYLQLLVDPVTFNK